MSFSNEFKINVNKLAADEMLLACLIITHPFLDDPVRLVNDNRDFVLNGHNHLAMPFQIKRQDDVQGELPKAVLTVSNVGRGLVRWIDSSGGGTDAKISVLISRRSTPNTIEDKIDFGIENVVINTETVTFSLVIQNNLIKRAMRYTYDKWRAPGLF